MKKFLLLAAALPFAVMGQDMDTEKANWLDRDLNQHASSKAFYYVFQQSQSTYNEITNPDFTYSGSWDDPEIVLPTPFGTDFLGVQTDSISMDLGANMLAVNYSTADMVLIGTTFADLIDRDEVVGGPGQSPISYVVEGTSPNRIFKMQWKNAGFYEELAIYNTANSFTNVQLWLYENEKIEFRFGASQVDAVLLDSLVAYGETASGMLRLNLITQSFDKVHLLTGSPSNATMVDTVGALTAWPSTGTVYSFQGSSIGLEDQNSPMVVDLYPNPATTELRVRCEAGQSFTVQLIDLSGQVVRTGSIDSDTAMDLSEIPAGLYLVKISNQKTGELVTKRLVVK